MKKFLAWLCLDSFRGRLDDCLAFAGSRRLFVFIRKVSAVCSRRFARKFFLISPCLWNPNTIYGPLYSVSLLEFVLFFNGIFRRGRTNIGFVQRLFFPSRTSKHLSSGSISKLEPRSERWIGATTSIPHVASQLHSPRYFCVMFPRYWPL